VEEKHLVLVVENVRSIFNVGSLFRTANAAGVEKIILVGYTPGPLDRFGRPRKDFAKVSLGAEKTLFWEHADDIVEVVRELKQKGFFCAALEQARGSADYRSCKEKNIALIVGNEIEGVSSTALTLADMILEIPLYGAKESLNVEVSAGIALFALRAS